MSKRLIGFLGTLTLINQWNAEMLYDSEMHITVQIAYSCHQLVILARVDKACMGGNVQLHACM